jgi:hypothetical protein
MLIIDQAGLLAHASPAYLPIRGCGQWLWRMRAIAAAGTATGSIYSYGDSAGFAPVFPFNDAKRQP